MQLLRNKMKNNLVFLSSLQHAPPKVNEMNNSVRRTGRGRSRAARRKGEWGERRNAETFLMLPAIENLTLVLWKEQVKVSIKSAEILY